MHHELPQRVKTDLTFVLAEISITACYSRSCVLPAPLTSPEKLNNNRIHLITGTVSWLRQYAGHGCPRWIGIRLKLNSSRTPITAIQRRIFYPLSQVRIVTKLRPDLNAKRPRVRIHETAGRATPASVPVNQTYKPVTAFPRSFKDRGEIDVVRILPVEIKLVAILAIHAATVRDFAFTRAGTRLRKRAFKRFRR
jgi:hypothetical protein